MIQKQYKIWESGEYNYPGYGNFSPSIMAYLHDDEEQKRPAVIIVPGGGYYMVCPWEGEIVAQEFYKKGYQTFVLTYTTNFLFKNPLNFQPLKDISRAAVFVRKHSDTFAIDDSKVAICGFSAGGHLCGSLAVHFESGELKETGKYRGISNRPDAAILCYPLITSEETYTNKECLSCFDALLGTNATPTEREYMSLEKHVTSNTPPIFLWHTAADEIVPVDNSILFEQACRKQNVPAALHIFGQGSHGMSLANNTFMTKSLSSLYSMEQFFETLPYFIESGEPIPPLFHYTGKLTSQTNLKEVENKYLQTTREMKAIAQADEEIAMWPELVDKWLQRIL